MKRRGLALCAGILLLALLPGATLAGNPTPPSNAANLDQWNNPDTVNFNGENGTYPSGQPFSFGQTFTAGKTGMLSEVALNLGVDSADNFTVDIYNVDQSTGLPTGPSLASTSASLSDVALSIWVYFSFPVPLSVTKNAQYAIVFSTGDNAEAYGSSDTYAGGQALTDKGGVWAFMGGLVSTPVDFAFMTFVDTVTTTVQWDPTIVTVGTTTPLTLTVTMTFANGSEANQFDARLGPLPGWFTPAKVTCSPQIDSSDCNVVTLQAWSGGSLAAGGDTVTISVTGMAAPLSDMGPPGDGAGEGCLDYPPPGSHRMWCNIADAGVQVVPAAPTPTPAPPTPSPTPTPTLAPAATPTPTPTPTPTMVVEAATAAPTRAPSPPPTSTGAGPGSDNTGGTIWFLPFALVAAFGGLLVLVDRRRRRLI